LGSTAGNTHTGSDVVRLGAALRLDTLSDGNGVRNAASLADFRVNLKDGTSFDVDLGAAATLGNAIDAINNHAGNGGKVATIDAEVDCPRLTDNTGGGGTSVSAPAAAKPPTWAFWAAASRHSGKQFWRTSGPAVESSRRLLALTAGSANHRTGRRTTAVNLPPPAARRMSSPPLTPPPRIVAASVNSSGDGLVLTDATGGASHHCQRQQRQHGAY
jgi:hypothetical protein